MLSIAIKFLHISKDLRRIRDEPKGACPRRVNRHVSTVTNVVIVGFIKTIGVFWQGPHLGHTVRPTHSRFPLSLRTIDRAGRQFDLITHKLELSSVANGLNAGVGTWIIVRDGLMQATCKFVLGVDGSGLWFCMMGCWIVNQFCFFCCWKISDECGWWCLCE